MTVPENASEENATDEYAIKNHALKNHALNEHALKKHAIETDSMERPRWLNGMHTSGTASRAEGKLADNRPLVNALPCQTHKSYEFQRVASPKCKQLRKGWDPNRPRAYLQRM